MSSDSAAKAPRVVYHSDRRTVVTDDVLVVEIAREEGWIRETASGGPMSGELRAEMAHGKWSRHLAPEEDALVAFALSSR